MCNGQQFSTRLDRKYYVLIIDAALYKLTRQSSTAFGCVSRRAVDGNSATVFNHGSCSCTGSEHQPWWEVDLGKSFNIAGVEITNRGDCCGERLRGFNITVDANL